MARSTSRHCTLPLPSQIALTGDSRNNLGIGESSITPLPPMHSMASAACCGARLQIQYFPTAVTRRTSASSLASVRLSIARAMRMESASAASDSSARSARTFFINGWSISSAPKAERRRQWWITWDRAMRIPALEPIMQSKRVMATISMMVRTPSPSSPTRQASAPRSSVSHDALETLPIFFFRRWICIGFLDPSGRQRGSRKQVRPAAVCARVRKPSHIGAETKNLCPTSS